MSRIALSAVLITLIASSAAAQPAAQTRAAAARAAAAEARAAFDAQATVLEAALTAAPDDLKLANDYRTFVIESAKNDRNTLKYDRAIAFFERLVAANPNAANAHLNHGFAYVDKIPAAGSITQVLLANTALSSFTRSLELKPSWIGLYTRGNSYLFWPVIFGRTRHGIADLQDAIELQKREPKRGYHVRTYIALGDGYYMLDELDKAAATWKEGLAEFPGNEALKGRLARQGDDLKNFVNAGYDPAKRVDTSLQDLWTK